MKMHATRVLPLALLTTHAALAAPTLEPATFDERIHSASGLTIVDPDPNSFYTPGVTEEDFADSRGFYSARAQTSPGNPASADVQISGTGIGASVTANASWEAAITGPAGVTRDIPIFVHLVGETSRTGNAFAYAESMIRLDNNFGQILISNLSRSSSINGIFNHGYDVLVARNVTIGPDGRKLHFSVFAAVNPTGAGPYEAQAIADPEFYIDPAWPFANEYTVTYSPGLIPEPATLSMLSGLAGGALLLRRSPSARRPPASTP